MSDRHGPFEILASDETQRRVAGRKALAAASSTAEYRFLSFLQPSATKEEFKERLALVRSDLDEVVKTAAKEHGYDDVNGLTKHVVRGLARQSDFLATT